MKPERISKLLLIAMCAGLSPGAEGQSASPAQPSYPTRPIRLVVPFAPGGVGDLQGRMLAEKLKERLGQPVVVDNRSGANGIIGMEIVARAPADGHTLVMSVVGTWAVHPYLYKLPYDVLKDFAPVILVATTPGVLVVHPSVKVTTTRELIALARQKPGELNYASTGVGGFNHIAAELFAYMTRIKLTPVPYKGAAPALIDLVGGHVHVLFGSAIAAIPHIQSGRARALATTGAKRLAALPDLPTIAEAGVPGYENSIWSAVGAPARTPQAIVARLNREIAAILQAPDMHERFAAGGSTITGGTPQQFHDYLKSELAKFGKLVRETGIKPEQG